MRQRQGKEKKMKTVYVVYCGEGILGVYTNIKAAYGRASDSQGNHHDGGYLKALKELKRLGFYEIESIEYRGETTKIERNYLATKYVP